MEQPLDDHLLGNHQDEDFVFYMNFHYQEDALPYLDLLKNNKIPWRLEGTETLITEAIVGSPNFPKIVLKVLPDDFKKVNEIIEEEILNNGTDFEAHYLNDSTDRELLALLRKPDESNIEEIVVAKQLLKIRGIPIESSAIENMKQERLEVLQQGRSGSQVWMTVYLLGLVIGSFLFSPLAMLAGVGMGWYYWKDKSVDIDGNAYLTFDEKTRNFGFFMVVLSAILFVVIVLAAIIFGINLITPFPVLEENIF